MSIADKLVYLDETKTKLRDAINIALAARGEAPLDSNDTFRSYAERLFYPGFLFGQGEQGGYSLPPNPDSYFTGTAGTTPAALTDAIALVQGEVGPDWTQGTATARPVWAREPEGGRRNLLTWSEDLSNDSWQKIQVTLSDMQPNGAIKLAVNGGADTGVTVLQKFSQVPALVGPVTVSISAAESGSRYLILAPVATNDFNYAVAQFDLVDGSVVTSRFRGGNYAQAQTPPSIVPDPENPGYWICSVSVNITTTPITPAFIVTCNDTPLATTNFSDFFSHFSASGTDGVYILQPQLERKDGRSEYQLVTTAADVTEAGVPDVPYVRFDLADDVLTTTLPAATYTVVLPTRQGIWFDSVTHAGGSFSVGPTSYTGGPAGILTALESDGVAKLIAPPLLIDRALSEPERAALVQWYQSQGAGPELELGPEINTSTDFTAWTDPTVPDGWNKAGAHIPGTQYVEQNANGMRLYTTGASIDVRRTELSGTYLVKAEIFSVTAGEWALYAAGQRQTGGAPATIDMVCKSEADAIFSVGRRNAGVVNDFVIRSFSIRRIQPVGGA